MKPKAICMLLMGIKEQYKSGVESAIAYADKIGADFYLISDMLYRYRFLHFEKMQLTHLLDKYNRVLYLDADVVVSPNARDIFEVYNDDSKFYAYDENINAGIECMDRDEDIESIPRDFEWPKNSEGKYKYFNAGVMLFSQRHKNFFEGFHTVPDVPNMWKYAEQTCINYLVAKNGVEWDSIEHSFNRMDIGSPDPEHLRLEADIIHYAGPCKYTESPQKDKFEQMTKDYNELIA